MDGRTHTFAGYTAGLLLVQAQINGLFELPAPEGLLPAVRLPLLWLWVPMPYKWGLVLL